MSLSSSTASPSPPHLQPWTSTCTDLAHPSVIDFVFSILIALGIVASYLPQHLRILSRRSSEGISPYFVLLGTTSSSFAIFNILTLPVTRDTVGCCREIDRFSCASALLGVVQVGGQWLCFNIIMLLFLIFFPVPGPEPHPPGSPKPPTWRLALSVAILSGTLSTLLLFLSAVLHLWYPHLLRLYSSTLGVFAALLACVQYLPQLWTTWRLQHVMSLSIPMMCIQTPGSFVWAASLAARLGPGGWSTWGVLVVTGCLQGALLAMGVCFEVKERRKRRGEVGVEQAAEDEGSLGDERTPLLGT